MRFPTPAKFVKTTLCFLIFILGVFLAFFFLRPAPPAVVVLPHENAVRMRRPILSYLPAAVQETINGARNKMFGPRPAILIETGLAELSSQSRDSLSNSLPAPTAVSGDGTRLWIVSKERYTEIRSALASQSGINIPLAPKVTTHHDAEALVFMGQVVPYQGTNVDVGFISEFLPRISKENIDVTFKATATELKEINSIQTNLAFAARVQLPPGHNLILLKPNRNGAKDLALFLGLVPQSKK